MTGHELRDDIVFAAEDTAGASARERKTWKLLIVDDEEDVHSITRMVLEGFEFEGGSLEFLSAFSAQEGRRVLAANPDVAVILLDVVMETGHAGLDLARQVREELGNRLVRIILRTGQPGQAPERQVIINYDINDYKSKSELTAQKLFTAVTTGIRSYRDLRAIDSSRQGLEDIIAASADLFQADSLELFARGVLTQMTSLLHLEDSSMYMGDASGLAARDRADDFIIVAGTGDFANQEARLPARCSMWTRWISSAGPRMRTTVFSAGPATRVASAWPAGPGMCSFCACGASCLCWKGIWSRCSRPT